MPCSLFIKAILTFYYYKFSIILLFYLLPIFVFTPTTYFSRSFLLIHIRAGYSDFYQNSHFQGPTYTLRWIIQCLSFPFKMNVRHFWIQVLQKLHHSFFFFIFFVSHFLQNLFHWYLCLFVDKRLFNSRTFHINDDWKFGLWWMFGKFIFCNCYVNCTISGYEVFGRIKRENHI